MRHLAFVAHVTAAGLLALAAPMQAQDKDKNPKLETCDKKIGALAVHEPQNDMVLAFRRYGLQSPTGLIRMYAQQSGCFLVLERGVAMQNMQQERELAKSGDLEAGSNMGGGQMKAADYVLTPAVVFSENNAGGVGGVVGGALGRSVLGGVGGGLKFKEAETSMLVADARSGVQVSAAQGKARATNFSLGALGFGAGALVGLGGYSNTNEGKVIAASYLDNINKIIVQMKADPSLVKVAADGSHAGTEPKAGAVFNEGDVLVPKIDNVKVFSQPADGASPGTVKKTDEMVYLGEEKNGYVKVQTSSFEGWVKKTLVSKR